jgi:glycosyltransferase involved in cell wall biosynthesis
VKSLGMDDKMHQPIRDGRLERPARIPSVTRPSILVLAGPEAAPVRYRVTHLMEQLRLLDIRGTALQAHDERALALCGEHEILLLQRISWDAYIQRVVERARRAGALPVFGIDDLLFDPAHLPPHLAELDSDEVLAWRELVASYRRTFEACDAFIGSTPALIRAAQRFGKPAFLHRNALSLDLIELSAAAPTQKSGGDESVTLGYFAGGRTHARDFAVAAPALARVLKARPQARLLLVGPVPVPRVLAPFSARIDRQLIVPWRRLPELIARVQVNLAPLELKNSFADAKSELKYFEAAAAGVPTIASPSEPFTRAIRHGENGLVASAEADWEKSLLLLIDHPGERARMAEAARRDALAVYSPQAAAVELSTVVDALSAQRGSEPLQRMRAVSRHEVLALKALGLGIGNPADEMEDAQPGPEQLAVRLASPRIWGNICAVQPIEAPCGWLVRVDLLVGTHRSVNLHDLHLRVLDDRDQELTSAAVDAASACDNAWLGLSLDPPLRLDQTRVLKLILEAPEAVADTGLSVFYEPVDGGTGTVAELRDLNLTYRTWMRPLDWQPDSARRATESASAQIERRVLRLEERLFLLAAELEATNAKLSSLRFFLEPLLQIKETAPIRMARKLARRIRAR